ncbi:MAG: dihydroorotase [Clostridia bacterium]|nr:dihydroorotase [Clostridia bacterium]
MSLVLKNALLTDPVSGAERPGDLLVEGGRIAALGSFPVPEDARVIDCGGRALAPALIDAHVHLRDPGLTHKEDFFTGGQAAVAGGFCAVAAMANTAPVNDTPELIRDAVLRSATGSAVRVLPVAAVTFSLKGGGMTEMEALAEAGAAAFSDDGFPVLHAHHMKEALQRAAALGKPLLSHSEEMSLAPTDPGSESQAVLRDVELAKETGCPIHICHVSSAESVAHIRRAKAEGVAVTAETAPHYLTFTMDDVKGNPNFKMNPPLRSAADRAALLDALCDGTLDLIATDHAPHSPEEKAQPFDKAPNGIIGLETSFAASYTALVKSGRLTLPQLLCKMSTAPARLLGVPGGELAVGAPADLVLLDLSEEWVPSPENTRSRSRNSPFYGLTLTGRVKLTLIGGEIVFSQL